MSDKKIYFNTLQIENSAELPLEIEITPLLQEHMHKKGKFSISEKDLEDMVRNFENSATDIVIDAEHQTLNTEKNGRPAPAYGWVKNLYRKEQQEGPALFASVKWTKLGEEALANGGYRYLSPVFWFDAADRKTGKPIGTCLHSIGLTNVPNIEGIRPLYNKLEGGELMDEGLKALLTLLGVDPQGDEALKAAEEEINRLKSLENGEGSNEGLQEIAKALALEGEATLEAILGEIEKLKNPGEEKEEEKGQDEPLQNRLGLRDIETLLDNKLLKQRAADVIEDGIRTGTIAPCQKDVLLNKAQSDPEFVIGFVKSSPGAVPISNGLKTASMISTGVYLTEEEELIANQLGLEKEKLLDTRKAELMKEDF